MDAPPRKIRLVHVTTIPETLGFFGGQVAFLRERGFEIQAIASPGEWGDRFARSEAVPFHPVPMSRKIDVWGDLKALARLWIQFSRIRPDIVHAHTPKGGLLGVLAARFARVPVVLFSIFGLPQMTMRGAKKTLMNTLTRIACASADRVWCDSFSMRDFVIENKLCAPQRVFVMANGSVAGVDAKTTFSPELYSPEVRARIRDLYGIPRDSIVLGFVGRIAKDKGLHELGAAWRILKEQRPDLHLLIIGQWEQKDPISPEDAELFKSDPRIHLVGFTHEVASYFAAMDIYVMPSYREGFGLTNIEASAMKLPIVSTQIPGCIDSVTDGVTGLLVPPGDVENLVLSIQTYLASPTLRQKHGQSGRDRVLRDFQPEMIWEDLLKNYRQLLKDKRTHDYGD